LLLVVVVVVVVVVGDLCSLRGALSNQTVRKLVDDRSRYMAS
jgi:hypothetical protein